MVRKVTKPARKRTDTVKLNLRFSEWLRRGLVREAKKRNRSLNTEIVMRLEHSLLREAINTPLSSVTLGEVFAIFEEYSK